MKYVIILVIVLLPLILFGQQNSPEDFSGSWTTGSSMGFTPRAALTSSVVNGKIYVMGGYSNDTTFLNTLEVFDPLANSWSAPKTTGIFSPRRGLCSAVVNDKIYVMGGYDGKNWLNTLEVFDPSNNTWTTPASTGTFTAREKLCCSVVDNKIYVMGGFNGIKHFNLLEVFDPSTNIWSTPATTGIFTPRRGLASTVINGKIYVMGGFNGNVYLNTFEIFDPVSKTWSTPITTGTFTERGALASSVLGDKIYAMGGVNFTSGGYHNLNILEVFDPITNVWSTPVTSGTFSARELLTSAVVSGKIYAMGGNRGIFLNTNEVFTPAANGVKVADLSQSITLVPNPTNGVMNVEGATSNIVSMVVMNILGETVMELKNLHSPDFTLDLSNLVAGIYYVRFSSANSVVTKKVVRQ